MTGFVILNQPSTDVEPNANERAVELCNELGLVQQAKRHQATGNIPHIFAKCAMSADEQLIWAAYCPTRYFEFKDYIFDTIPLAVLEHWAKCKTEFAFDSFEIRTTEQTVNRDPLLIGWFQNVPYLLARWGEESPDNMPTFANVCEALVKQLHEALERRVAQWQRDWGIFGFLATKERAWRATEKEVRHDESLYGMQGHRAMVTLDRMGYNVFGA